MSGGIGHVDVDVLHTVTVDVACGAGLHPAPAAFALGDGYGDRPRPKHLAGAGQCAHGHLAETGEVPVEDHVLGADDAEILGAVTRVRHQGGAGGAGVGREGSHTLVEAARPYDHVRVTVVIEVTGWLHIDEAPRRQWLGPQWCACRSGDRAHRGDVAVDEGIPVVAAIAVDVTGGRRARLGRVTPAHRQRPGLRPRDAA